MAHAIATRMSHIRYHADRHEQQWKRVTASFFVKDLGLALAPKMCPDQSQAFKEVNNSQAFTVGRKKTFFLWRRRFQVLQGMFVQSFAQIFEELAA